MVFFKSRPIVLFDIEPTICRLITFPPSKRNVQSCSSLGRFRTHKCYNPSFDVTCCLKWYRQYFLNLALHGCIESIRYKFSADIVYYHRSGAGLFGYILPLCSMPLFSSKFNNINSFDRCRRMHSAFVISSYSWHNQKFILKNQKQII